MGNDIVWQPSLERRRTSALWDFATRTADDHGCAPDDYDGLLSWSIREPEQYHAALWDFAGIVGTRGERVWVDGPSLRETRIFPDATLNYAENLLRVHDEQPAIIAHRDDGTRREISRTELYNLVSRVVQALRAEGVGPGDRVAAIVTCDIEAIAGYLATSAIGAVWASCSPDFGPEGAADRLAQIEPKVLLAVAGYGYAGKQIDVTASINAVAAATPLSRIVTIGGARAYDAPSIGWDDWLAPYAGGEIAFHRQPLDAPLVVLFSSGTTGKPKCIVHSSGGLLLQHIKEHRLHCNIGPGDRFFYYTTCGWMMWNWLVTGLASGATLVTFDGNPFHPAVDRLVDLIDSEGVTVFGTSAKYIDHAQNNAIRPRETHNLSALKTILSTGSPLLPQNFDYIYRDWKPDLHLASISGGTDICACFIGGVPTKPVRRGELQGAQLGLDVRAFDDDGQPVLNRPGELVCRNAHLSMPVGFWGDEDGSRYDAAYFSRYPNVWAHGDYVEKTDAGGFIIHGRSDTTLNPGGVRIGTAEIYRQVEAIDMVEEAIAVGQDWQGDQRVILFVRMKAGIALTEEMIATIKARIRKGATPRHVPAKIIAVPAIPRTRSGKISEIAVRDTIHGRPIKNDTALANPECLAAYTDLPQLKA
jgi:acetoacetyl-CoA synthetase